jgi:hypothetical protein
MTVSRWFGFAVWALIVMGILISVADAKPVAIASSANDSVTLHDEECVLKGWRRAVYRKGKDTLEGCWTVKEQIIVTVWADGDVLPMPPNVFKPVTAI